MRDRAQDECGQITELLKAWRTGDNAALKRLTPLVYDQLRRMARRLMRNERGNSLQTTALVHEAYLRLADAQKLDWNDRVHFFAVAAQMMRRILVSAARKRLSAKRGGDAQRISHSAAINFDEIPKVDNGRGAELIALDDALGDLARIDIRKVRVIELRFFGGLSVEETAEALKISPQSVMRDWKLAKAWLKRELTSQEPKSNSFVSSGEGETAKAVRMPKPDVSKMGYNPANFAHWIGEEPWVPGYSVNYAISFYDARTGVESERSAWWGPKSDPKKLYGGFGLIRIPTDPTGQATGRRIWRKFVGQPEKLIHEIPDNVTTKYQDDVR